jgi:outer membrane receptor for Fe3+-dicitrate
MPPKREKFVPHLNVGWSEKASFYFFLLVGGTFGTAATTGLSYQPRMIGDGDCGEIGGVEIDRGNRSTYSEKTCSSATLSTTNPT